MASTRSRVPVLVVAAATSMLAVVVAGPSIFAGLQAGNASGLDVLGIGAVLLLVTVGAFDVVGLVAAARGVGAAEPERATTDKGE